MFGAAVACCAFVVPAMAQQSDNTDEPPSFRAGDWLVVKPRTKIHLDFRGFQPVLDDKRKIFHKRRLRVGADGILFRDFEYSVRVEARTADLEFRDVFLKYRQLPSFQIQAGRFKIPFGLDQLTDSGELDFVQRSRVGSILAPGRDTGAMVLGELLEQKVFYSAGIFRHDGKNSEIEDFTAIDEYSAGGNRTVAARVTVAPFDNLELGTAFTRSDVATGLSSLPGVTVSDQLFFPRMYVSGSRLRRGAELSWLLRSLSIKGEFVDVREQRLGQGLGGEDLPALRTQGWYLSATHPLLGRIDNGPRGGFLRSILPGKRLGLFEVAARYEVIRFSSKASTGSLPSRNPRAPNVAGNDDRVWTFGINWYLNRYLRFQFNGIRETLRDPVRTPMDGVAHYWTEVGRFQLYF